MNNTEFRIELINHPFLLQIYSPTDPMLLMFYPDKLAIHKPNSIQLKAQGIGLVLKRSLDLILAESHSYYLQL